LACEILSRKVGISARTDREDAISVAAEIARCFEDKGFDVLIEPKLADLMNRRKDAVPLEKMKADLIVTIGGDGTILRTCLRIPKPEPPILAVDMGVRGFLTEINPERTVEAVKRYLKGEYFIERCSKIASFIGEKRLPDALNEVFITSRHLAKLLYVRVIKNGETVMNCRADGVIVASQAGSTGYAFSAGGPIIDPELDAFVLTPVCPIMFIRPVVFPSSSEVTIELLRPKSAAVVIDGDYRCEINEENPFLKIRKSEYESSFIRFEGIFYNRLKTRLLFSREEI